MRFHYNLCWGLWNDWAYRYRESSFIIRTSNRMGNFCLSHISNMSKLMSKKMKIEINVLETERCFPNLNPKWIKYVETYIDSMLLFALLFSASIELKFIIQFSSSITASFSMIVSNWNWIFETNQHFHLNVHIISMNFPGRRNLIEFPKPHFSLLKIFAFHVSHSMALINHWLNHSRNKTISK